MKEQSTTSVEEIVYESDDLIEFGEYDGENGTYVIQVHRNEPDTNGFREIYSGIESYDSDGNTVGSWLEDFPDHIATAKQRWNKMAEQFA